MKLCMTANYRLKDKCNVALFISLLIPIYLYFFDFVEKA